MEHPVFLVDGAHNEDAAQKLRMSMERYFPGRRLILILGVFKDKEYEKIASILCPLAQQVYTVDLPNVERTLPAEKLAECAKKYCRQTAAAGRIEDAVEKAVLDANTQYGTLVVDDGNMLSGAIDFEKRDDHTFVTGINYELFLTHDDLAGHTATLTLSDLVACNKSIVETDGKSYWHYDYADQTPLPGSYTLTFTIPEASDAGVRTLPAPVEQDGVTLQSIKATPAATKVLLTFPPEQHWVSVKLYTADGTELGHERGEGGWWTDGAWTADPADFDHPEQCTKASYDYFAAVPENCHSLTVKVYDFDTDAELTTFTVELP